MRAKLTRIGLAAVLLCAGCAPRTSDDAAGIDVAAALGGAAAEGFARAVEPHEFSFPADHGAHPGFRNEWWYFTGNLDAEDGRRFGFQLTLFRIALTPQAAQRASGWATDTVWMGHFAITDVDGQRHHGFERFARGAAGLAGAQTSPLRIWLGDWQISGGTAGDAPWRIEAGEQGVGLRLDLRAVSDIVLQGEGGLSRKSAEPGNASYYYSIPRLAALGEVTLGGQRHAVRGTAWLDREWSTSALGSDQAGWDWFALQLTDGTDLMYYRLRRKDGRVDPLSRGSVSLAGQGQVALRPEDVEVEPLSYWTSADGVTYPATWRMRFPALGRALTLRPVVAEQEMRLSVRYWEGAVDVLDEQGTRIGRGYVELAGYDRGRNPR